MVNLLAFASLLTMVQKHSTAPIVEFKIPAGIATQMRAVHGRLDATSKNAALSELKDITLQLPNGCQLTVKRMQLTMTKLKDGSIVIRSAAAESASALEAENRRLRAKIQQVQAGIDELCRARAELKRTNEQLVIDAKTLTPRK